MKKFIQNGVLGFVLAASTAYCAIPSINVLVADASGKAAYKGVTNAKGSFATGALKPGAYVVQFTSSTAPKSARYTLVISAGSKKVSAEAIASERLAGGGVAMKIDVGTGLNVTGQVVAQDKDSAPLGKNGKPMVWVPKKLGSNLAAHWAESDSTEAKEARTQANISMKDMQDKQNQGKPPSQSGD